jgi:cytochrome P450
VTETEATQPTGAAACPYPFDTPVSVPVDGTPLTPSPCLAEFRKAGAAVPLRYADGHEGLLTTTWDFARSVLGDPRFTITNWRFPLDRQPGAAHSQVEDDPIDALAEEALEIANLLKLDAPEHSRLRKAITGRMSVRAVRTYEERVREIVRRQLDHLLAVGSPANLTLEYAEPISAYDHCLLLGIADELVPDFFATFLQATPRQQKHDFVRAAVDARRDSLGEDTISDLLRSDLTPAEVEGVLVLLMAAGRDTVAYMIATGTNMLLKNPAQLQLLRDDPELIQTGVEEILRYGAMFVTLFPRTALEDVEIGGIRIPKGTTVSASQVAGNRDPHRWEDPDRLDLTRDAFGHLSFGHGQHGCVGQQYARMQVREALTQLIAAMPDLRLVEAEQDRPIRPFPSELPTYHAGNVVIAW